MPGRLFLGTWGRRGGRGIWGADWNEESGTVGRLRLLTETPNPTFIAVHPRQPILYAVNETSEHLGAPGGGLSVFRISTEDGSLREVASRSAGGMSPTHLAISPSGNVLALAHYHGPGIACFGLDAGGMPELEAAINLHTGRSIHPTRQDRPHPHGVYFGLSGDDLWVPDLGADRIIGYSVSASVTSAGGLVMKDAFAMTPGAGPRHLAVERERRTIYCINELNNTLSVFSVDALGRLWILQQVPLLPAEGREQNAAAEVAVHPSGQFVYASTRGADVLTIFAREPDGRLKYMSHCATGGRTPRHFEISPSGRWLIVVNQDSDSITVFSVGEAGAVIRPQETHAITAPACVRFGMM